MYGQSVFWRESMKPSKFLIFDGRVVLVIVPTFVYMRMWTLGIAIATMFIFWLFERKGVRADAIVRFLRSKIVGNKRSARGIHEERPAVDFGFECKAFLTKAEIEAAKLVAEETAALSGKSQTSLLDRLNPFAKKTAAPMVVEAPDE